MNKRLFLLPLVAMLGACAGLPDLPELPNIAEVAIPKPTDEETPVAESKKQSVACVREGNGFLSYTYNEGHLDELTLLRKDREFSLSKGVTIIQKEPLGRYTTKVTGYQKSPITLDTLLECDGETIAYEFGVKVPKSSSSAVGVRNESLTHNWGELVIGSTLLDYEIQLTKLDAPYLVFEKPSCEKESCPTDNRTLINATESSLPEGRYSVRPAIGNSAEIYIKASSYNAIEVTEEGVVVTSQEVVLPSSTENGEEVSKLLRSILPSGG